MKVKLAIVIVILIAATVSLAQENKSWEKLNYLIGNWKGEGGGKPGEGEGTFSFQLDLDKKILVRKSHSEYPAAQNKPEVIHDDLMVVHLNYSGNPEKAIYFDNEGHVINYSITFPNNSDIVFTSDKIPNVPIFRLTYSKIDENLVNVKFEMSQDGTNFMRYVEGKSKRIKD